MWVASPSLLPKATPAADFVALAEAEAMLKALPMVREEDGGRLFCRQVDALSTADLTPALKDNDPTRAEEAEQLAERACLVFAFLSYAYLRAGAVERSELPPALAVPWHAAATYLGRAMSLDYVSTVLTNCVVDETEGGGRLGEVTVGATFTGTRDEAHFYALHARIEAAAAPAVQAMLRVLEPPAAVDAAVLAAALEDVAKGVRAVAKLLPRMRDGCAPPVFYDRIRPLLAGFTHPIRLRGVRGGPLGAFASRTYATLRGASGAQSALLPCVDAFLGIGHTGPREMPEYAPSRVEHMPLAHRALLRRLRAAAPAAPDAVEALCTVAAAESSGAAARLRRARASCTDALMAFRKAHLALATAYILSPAAAAATPTPSATPSQTIRHCPAVDVGPSPSSPQSIVATAQELLAQRRASRGAPFSKEAGATADDVHGTGGSSVVGFLVGRLEDTR